MIETGHGDLLNADVEALVNTVNSVGVMGRGLALQFKRQFPENFHAYVAACKRDQVEIGRMLVVETKSERVSTLDLFVDPSTKKRTKPRYIINFPTKEHWRGTSRLEYVQTGLIALVEEIRERNIHSVAVPPLGCGNGSLAWLDVEPLIRRELAILIDVRIVLFTPRLLV